MVFFWTPVSITPGIVIGVTGVPGFTSLNHFSTSALVLAGSMSPATTRLALPGA
jgi:hypothetical protein